MKKIALISCTKKKQTYECPAQELYLPSSLFKKAKLYVQRKEYDGWYILSALHGLLSPDQVVAPYNQTLNSMSIVDIRDWSKKVADQVISLNPKEIHFYAGDNYRKELIPRLEKAGIVCYVPLRGKRIGEQLAFYNEELKGF
ncbi:hypothetical protein EHV15_34200 [Paenibacillus oralis]|uniref:DUF6884 domain-containing protein n=1 Tax=Paenibacillus oralis TaxID=2490856 RepID=A0A3P3T9E1_9BACL|nr:DUF6884 domain-containing protein [Paenibacillus oralis]RRJ54651.1 hypothetical protein EHV15_34200 [Paenibacillus oralis]